MGDAAHDTELVQRVARLATLVQHARPGDLATEVDSIRASAEAAGVLPVVAVARALEAALARGERGVILRGWIAMLGEAAGCGTCDAQTGNVLLAAAALRFG
jgi:hypothetical protein